MNAFKTERIVLKEERDMTMVATVDSYCRQLLIKWDLLHSATQENSDLSAVQRDKYSADSQFIRSQVPL